MIVYWLVEAVLAVAGFVVAYVALYVPLTAILRRRNCARLEAAECVAETTAWQARALRAERDAVALVADNDNLRATIVNLTAACEHHVTAHGTLLHMLAQVQMTMLNMPYWASPPAQEATRVAE